MLARRSLRESSPTWALWRQAEECCRTWTNSCVQVRSRHPGINTRRHTHTTPVSTPVSAVSNWSDKSISCVMHIFYLFIYFFLGGGLLLQISSTGQAPLAALRGSLGLDSCPAWQMCIYIYILHGREVCLDLLKEYYILYVHCAVNVSQTGARSDFIS